MLFIFCAGGVSELCGMRFGGHKGPPKRKKMKSGGEQDAEEIEGVIRHKRRGRQRRKEDSWKPQVNSGGVGVRSGRSVVRSSSSS